MASMFFAAGTPLDRTRRDAALDAARAVMDQHPQVKATAGATSPNERMAVVRVLAPQVEPAMKLLKAVRVAWREVLWGLDGEAPRIWAM
jgi:urease accessory protein